MKNGLILSEHSIQSSFFKWVDIMSKTDERYLNIWAVPNGARTNIITAVKLKREGLRKGVPDVTIAVPTKTRPGAFIEFKKIGGPVALEQRLILERLGRMGYAVIVCRSTEQGIEFVKEYLS